MNDSVEIQSPPSKKFKQAEIAIETNSDNKDIEKENKPIDEDSPSVDDEVEEKKAPQTPKSNSRPSTATPKSTTGKKRSREEIEANKLERERKKKEKEEKEEQRKLAWAQTLQERELKKKQKEEEKLKREEQRAKEKLEREEKAKILAEEKAKKEEQRAKEKAEREEKLKIQAEEKAKRLQEKEELKRKKEEEKAKEEKKKEEERLAIEAKKKTEQNKFKSFFSSVKKRQITVAKSENTSRWVKFEPRENQSVAPVCYRFLSYEEKNNLEQNLKNQPGSDYFTEIKNRSIYKRTKCQSVIQKDDDCKFINPELEKAMKQGARLKLLQFHRNYRPAFYGTFRKKTKLTGKVPFRKDEKLFDYNFDSDEEWEDEPEDAEEIDQNDEMSGKV